MLRILIALSFVATITFSCNSQKKNQTSPSSEIVAASSTQQADTAKEETVKKEIYRASNPRSNDIIHTKLEVNFDWEKSRMNGKATIQLKPYFYPTQMLYLDARGMEIKSLNVFEAANNNLGNKTNASYKYENDSLKINLGKTFTAKENYFVVIEYIAKPDELESVGGSNAIHSDKGLYFINPKGENPYKMPQLWTQGETQASSVWFPTIDSPNEKMTQEIFMTVDDKYTTLSNGILVSSKKNADNTRTDYWKQDKPHSTYLAMMAVGEFKKVTDKAWNGKEISYYVEKDYEPHAKAIFGDTKEMIEFYSNKLGVPYAWDKYAQIAVRDFVSGAMENTSATLHGDFMVYQTTRETIDGKKGEAVIAHELFHQWFGDLVTAESWSNLPLNESFATYGEYLWYEYKHGRDAADYHHWQSKQGYLGYNKEVDLVRFHYDNKEDMFDGFSYNKGGQVLHILRKAVGDDAFFASLKNYLETKKFKSAEIHDLRLAFEEITGQDMNWFFNQWFLNKGRPKLKVSKTFDTTKNELYLTVEQTQDFKNVPLYRLPLEIDVYTNDKATRTHILVDDVKQTFTIQTTTPQLVNFDAERQLLCDLEYEKTKAEYAVQYKHAPLYEDRLEALKNLETHISSDISVLALFKSAAQHDKFYQLRNFALSKLELATNDKDNVKQILMRIYNNDVHTRVRAKALNALNKNYKGDADVMALNEKALSEQSYAIIGEALQAFAKADVKLAMQRAKAFENESGKDVLFPIFNLYAENGNDEHIAFFHNSIKYLNGFEFMTFFSAYSKLAKRCEKPENAILAANDIEMLSRGASKFVKFAAQKCLKDILNVWQIQEDALKAVLVALKEENRDISEAEKELKTVSETKNTLASILEKMK
ncbi:MAG: M1 family metallopeptidase [Bacteroidetes bacterium]|nr:M1 family metallopeptidase [Bacteroidota bacterium]